MKKVQSINSIDSRREEKKNTKEDVCSIENNKKRDDSNRSKCIFNHNKGK